MLIHCMTSCLRGQEKSLANCKVDSNLWHTMKRKAHVRCIMSNISTAVTSVLDFESAPTYCIPPPAAIAAKVVPMVDNNGINARQEGAASKSASMTQLSKNYPQVNECACFLRQDVLKYFLRYLCCICNITRTRSIPHAFLEHEWRESRLTQGRYITLACYDHLRQTPLETLAVRFRLQCKNAKSTGGGLAQHFSCILNMLASYHVGKGVYERLSFVSCSRLGHRPTLWPAEMFCTIW